MTSLNGSERDPQTYTIIGAAMEVHRQMGPGFLEAVYQEALALEFGLRTIPALREMELPVWYKGRRLICSYMADFVCYRRVILEVKAMKKITGVEEAQLLNYLKATRLEHGLLINFGAPQFELKRLIFSNSRKAHTEGHDKESL